MKLTITKKENTHILTDRKTKVK